MDIKRAEQTMQEIVKITYCETRHKLADNLLCEILKSEGYDEVVSLFEKMDKWYS